MKPVTLIYCGTDGAGAKALAASLRDGMRTIALRDAYSFDGVPEGKPDVVVMADVPQWHRDRIAAAYGIRGDAESPPVSAEPSVPVKRKRGRPKKVIADGADR